MLHRGPTMDLLFGGGDGDLAGAGSRADGGGRPMRPALALLAARLARRARAGRRSRTAAGLGGARPRAARHARRGLGARARLGPARGRRRRPRRRHGLGHAARPARAACASSSWSLARGSWPASSICAAACRSRSSPSRWSCSTASAGRALGSSLGAFPLQPGSCSAWPGARLVTAPLAPLVARVARRLRERLDESEARRDDAPRHAAAGAAMSHLAGDRPADRRAAAPRSPRCSAPSFAIFELRLFQLQLVEGDELREQALAQLGAHRCGSRRRAARSWTARAACSRRRARPSSSRSCPSDLQRRDVTFAALGAAARARSGRARRAGRQPARHRALPARAPRRRPRRRPARARGDAPLRAARRRRRDVRPLRHYLDGPLAAHLLGTLGEIRGDQLEQESFADYRSGDVIGQTGLESRPRGGAARARGRPQRDGRRGGPRGGGARARSRPRPGSRVVLDARPRPPARGLGGVPRRPGGRARRRWARRSRIDVRNGDVLVMLSQPAFDPNAFAGGIDAATWKALTDDEWDPLQNRAIQNHYPPGSTHKAFVAAALLAGGRDQRAQPRVLPGLLPLRRPHLPLLEAGGPRLGGPARRRSSSRATCSSTPFGVQLGIDRLAHIAKSFGLGQPTGIGLSGEASGLVPSSEWKQRRFGERWYPGETVSASIGQGYNLYTPIQLAVGLRGDRERQRIVPRLVLRIESATRASSRSAARARRRRSRVTPGAPRAGAARHDGGGRGAGRHGRTRAGAGRAGGRQDRHRAGRAASSTPRHGGDATIPIRYRDHAWFGAFAPADAPEIAVGVFVEHGLHGSTGAGPDRRSASWRATSRSAA